MSPNGFSRTTDMFLALTCAAPLFLSSAGGVVDETADVLPRDAATCVALPAAAGVLPAAAGVLPAAAGPAQGRGGVNASPARGAAQRGDGAITVSIQAEDRTQLTGEYFAPSGRDHAPGVLLLHDAGSSRTAFGDLATQLQRRGFAVLALDLRGHGQSVGDRAEFARATPEDQRTLWALATRDVQAGATWLRQRAEVHSTNLNIIGVGAGVGLAVRHAVRDENVRSLVLIRPCSEQYGFDLAADLRAIEGLPTFFAAPNDVRSEVREMLKGLAAQDTVKVDYVRDAQGPLLDERRVPRAIVGWIGEQAMPRRGRS